eukprot:TRINITY_DN1652_c0_g1_i1.p1 TRINITY_DN1652_c0_g1~~TRINITY_DN1652_c0_g1_i1.p1  ORF type:complete len:233 (-),score=44.81 TRINITY_DN1652_c0_g1_i1:134-832(-)
MAVSHMTRAAWLLGLLALCICMGSASASKGKNFTALPKALIVKAQVLFPSSHGNMTVKNITLPGGLPNTVPTVLKAGIDKIRVTWKVNDTFLSDSSFKKVIIKLCYAPVSQTLRKWRKSNVNNLKKDKTCQYTIGSVPYTRAGSTVDWLVTKNVPDAKYFVRAYAVDGNLTVAFGAVAWGGNSPDRKTNLIHVDPISGRSTGLYIAIAVSSLISLTTLVGYFIREQHLAKTK